MPSEPELLDAKIRHYIYQRFIDSTLPPTTEDTARHFNQPISCVEDSFDRLAQAHQIALAPGSHSIWMAHPFSGIPTNHVTRIGSKTYWGN
ncbi:MAG: hypothetical protein D3926_02090 [Desulfobacteraceae bacterium]|nr:MAG: hypothetical protein D3926_02090 [Desulfobacteraceae bacterium]